MNPFRLFSVTIIFCSLVELWTPQLSVARQSSEEKQILQMYFDESDLIIS